MNADALEERRRVVLGRLLCEMESLPAPMYGEMVDALRALLATPNTLPPVEVGDYVDLDGFGLCYVPKPEAARLFSQGNDGLKAVYRRIWQRKETDRG